MQYFSLLIGRLNILLTSQSFLGGRIQLLTSFIFLKEKYLDSKLSQCKLLAGTKGRNIVIVNGGVGAGHCGGGVVVRKIRTAVGTM